MKYSKLVIGMTQSVCKNKGLFISKGTKMLIYINGKPFTRKLHGYRRTILN